ncbi:carbamoyl-phosphate synthase large subunit [Tangfeifania diversioriginum]|uniref:Carbamoyl-phosphate synthase large subunit n=1 Tax=Tangfeifania diversioriginum TaxID=1168035 RepID=A0A1M6LRM4_9BACT|nr:ATP-grasp domain-containing protein [Tangfeifania diversioriginum]SHJ73820.1 carbamoyl-phosphate synthase large subunit [Tangfeifania diversioriginum]
MNILLTSVGRRTYMVNYFKEALSGMGRVHAANSVETYSMKIADKSVLTPLIYDSNYIDFLLDYCLENNITAVISLFDIDLPILARNKIKFAEKGITVIVSDLELTQICNDKWLTYNFLIENEFQAPASFLTIEDTLTSVKNKAVKYPLIIKPRWGMGSIGIFQAESNKELQLFFKKTQEKIAKSYLKYESQNAPTENVIIQEKLPGDEFGLDVFNDLKGNLLACIPKKKLAMRAGETDAAEIINNTELVELGKKLSKKTKHIGNLDVDCFYKNNQVYILEMNCRFGGQYPFAHLAGVNFPKAIVQMLTGARVEKKLLRAKAGTIGIKDLLPVKLV